MKHVLTPPLPQDEDGTRLIDFSQTDPLLIEGDLDGFWDNDFASDIPISRQQNSAPVIAPTATRLRGYMVPIPKTSSEEKGHNVPIKVAQNNEGKNNDSCTTLAASKRNADACRRNRLKRKADEDNLRKRNEELEQNRGFFLHRIAELRFQVDVLRMAGSVDLRRENDLLRAEIRRHKAYLKDVVQVVKKHPRILLEEKARLLQSCLDDCMSQVIGLTYHSRQWARLHTIRRGNLSMNIYYDMLPKNVPLSEVKRINLRYEVLNAPASAKTFHHVLRMFDDNNTQNNRLKEIAEAEVCSRWQVNQLVSPELEETLAVLSPEGNVQISTYSEHQDDKARIQTTVIACSLEERKKLVPQALFEKHEEDIVRCNIIERMSSEVVPVYMHGMTNCDKELAQARIPFQTSAEVNFTKGHIIVPHPDDPNACHVIAVSTIPIGNFPKLLSPSDFITEDGRLADAYARLSAQQFDFFVEEMASYNETVE